MRKTAATMFRSLDTRTLFSRAALPRARKTLSARYGRTLRKFRRASKNSSYVFAGDIYCVRLYNRQLTNAEIASNQMIDELRFKSNAVAGSTFAVSSTMDGVGAPSPAYGYVCELSAGDTRAVSSDALWTNSTKVSPAGVP